MIDVNIKGVLYCTSAVIPYMVDKKSGHIVNLSSLAGRIVFAGGSVYCATKHAITAFSKGLRKELSPEYITYELHALNQELFQQNYSKQ